MKNKMLENLAWWLSQLTTEDKEQLEQKDRRREDTKTQR